MTWLDEYRKKILIDWDDPEWQETLREVLNLVLTLTCQVYLRKLNTRIDCELASLIKYGSAWR